MKEKLQKALISISLKVCEAKKSPCLNNINKLWGCTQN